MEIREMRERTGMGQGQFAKYFGIPLTTLKDWESGRRKPPQYIPKMMRKILRHENVFIKPDLSLLQRRNLVDEKIAIMRNERRKMDDILSKAYMAYTLQTITPEEMDEAISEYDKRMAHK